MKLKLRIAQHKQRAADGRGISLQTDARENGCGGLVPAEALAHLIGKIAGIKTQGLFIYLPVFIYLFFYSYSLFDFFYSLTV